mmetsp:Transcript_44418/g.117413  ORF Transcript_44418/g.117413 Transcript_44418/m.117413 type:complete len:321 (+) Transcript_44418:2334-3296(+)
MLVQKPAGQKLHCPALVSPELAGDPVHDSVHILPLSEARRKVTHVNHQHLHTQRGAMQLGDVGHGETKHNGFPDGAPWVVFVDHHVVKRASYGAVGDHRHPRSVPVLGEGLVALQRLPFEHDGWSCSRHHHATELFRVHVEASWHAVGMPLHCVDVLFCEIMLKNLWMQQSNVTAGLRGKRCASSGRKPAQALHGEDHGMVDSADCGPRCLHGHPPGIDHHTSTDALADVDHYLCREGDTLFKILQHSIESLVRVAAKHWHVHQRLLGSRLCWEADRIEIVPLLLEPLHNCLPEVAMQYPNLAPSLGDHLHRRIQRGIKK